MKPFTLSNGQRIPTGVTIKALSFAVDADLQPQNEFSKFDGLRHYKQRVNAHVAGDQARAQLVSTNEENMAFGYGRHACPGRFFAANEIKMILVKLLSNYDISLPDGISERHAQIPAGNFSYPDPSKKVVLKRLSVQAP
jgi:cytochrome P450